MQPNLVVLLPFATPHPAFAMNGVFHPAALPHQQNRKEKLLDETKDYTGFSCVKFASTVSHTVIATIPPKTTVAGLALDQLLSSFVNPENVLAEVERVEVTSKGTTIEAQVQCAFDACPTAKSVLIIWPYQMFTMAKDQPVLMSQTNAKFAFTHPMYNANRGDIAECVVVASASDDKEQNEITCKNAMAWSEVDELIRGSYTRVLSMLEVTRDEFNEFTATSADPSIAALAKKILPGTQGVLVNHQGFAFI